MLLMNLSKAFDTSLNLAPTVLDAKDLNILPELLQGMLQESVLYLLLFNINPNDLFYLADYSNVCNFGYYPTFSACNKILNTLFNRLDNDSFLMIYWFQKNCMKLHVGKFHLRIAGNKY